MSRIAWTNETCNVFVGCRKVSAGCARCYAETFAKRLRATGHPSYQKVVGADGWTGRFQTNVAQLQRLCRMKKRRMIFVCSMGDFFFEAIRDPLRDAALGEMIQARQHIWQILTKRPENAVRYYEGVRESHARCGEPSPFPSESRHIWHGVSIEDERTSRSRLGWLWRIPSAVRFVSCEPLLGRVDLHFGELLLDDEDSACGWGRCDYGGVPHQHWLGDPCGRCIDWVIVGCEAIHGRPGRFCGPEFFEALGEIIRQCRAAGVRLFIKQVPQTETNRVLRDPAAIVAEMTRYGILMPQADLWQWPRALQ